VVSNLVLTNYLSILRRARASSKSTMRRGARSGSSALLLWALASVHAQTGSITLVESDKAFEHEVMGGDACCRVQEVGPDGDIVTCQRHLLWLFVAPKALTVAALQRVWRRPLATPPLATLPTSCTQACWAILFISNNTEEPTEHTQMRFELASATLAERIQLGIVAVHEAPEAAAEFLTMETPQIGAADVARHTAPYPSAATHAARVWPVRSPVQSPRSCCMPVKGCVLAAELALAQVTRSAERAHPTLPVRHGRFRQAARFGPGHTRGGAVDASHSVWYRSRSLSSEQPAAHAR